MASSGAARRRRARRARGDRWGASSSLVSLMRAWRELRRAASSSVSSNDGVFPGGKPRRRVWETSLSPLERVRRLLPPEEAQAIGRYAAAPQTSPAEEEKEVLPLQVKAAAPQVTPEAAGARPGPFRSGEFALAEMQRKYNATLKLLCRLAEGSVLTSPGGLLPHSDIIGQLPGQMLHTSGRTRLLLRRPSLEEYVLLMPRGPTIAYPKDISAMLMMMDIHPGDTVLETGSGSGAMSLFLSRAETTDIQQDKIKNVAFAMTLRSLRTEEYDVCKLDTPQLHNNEEFCLAILTPYFSRVGPKGHVISYEIRDDHHNLAKKNYRHWRAAWEIGHLEEWPDNVDFILKDVSTAAADMKSVTLDAIVLDMLNPQSALPVLHPSLKQGGVCAVYLANITQVTDLLDRIRTCKLPFLCERIIEVTHRNWLVLPAKIKNGKSSQMVETQENIEEQPQKEYEEIHIQDQVVLKESENHESLSADAETYCSVPYIARPSYWQDAHSAFLTKLRKFRPLLS